MALFLAAAIEARVNGLGGIIRGFMSPSQLSSRERVAHGTSFLSTSHGWIISFLCQDGESESQPPKSLF